jgi:hypothetical protein
VKNRFQNLPFKCNLQRYTEDEEGVRALLAAEMRVWDLLKVG